MQPDADRIIMVTTAEIEGRAVLDYLGIVSGEATLELPRARRRVSPLARRDISAARLEQRLSQARAEAVAEMVQRARELDAKAILAVDVRYTSVQQPDAGDLIIITASGTAVTL